MAKEYKIHNKEYKVDCSGERKTSYKEAVDHPKHYNVGKIEVIDAIEEWGCGFCDGNVIKYVARHKHKENPVQDLKKAKWYLERLIESYEKKSN